MPRPRPALIDAGLHVFLEKPMATDPEECASLVEQAASRGVTIGVNHNFLFAPVYEDLRRDLAAGKLGRPDHVTITWNRELDQLRSGPFNLWMLRDPRNIMLEIGPHCLAPILDLIGVPELAGARASSPVDLPGGRKFYRRWHVEAEAGSAAVTLHFSFAPGFTEQTIHVRGTLGSATVDLERNLYVLRRHTRYGMDFDRYRMVRDEAGSLAAQARRTLTRYVLSKLKLSSKGSPYGLSIARALQSFYTGLGGGRRSPALRRDGPGPHRPLFRDRPDGRRRAVRRPGRGPSLRPSHPRGRPTAPRSWCWEPPVSSARSWHASCWQQERGSEFSSATRDDCPTTAGPGGRSLYRGSDASRGPREGDRREPLCLPSGPCERQNLGGVRPAGYRGHPSSRRRRACPEGVRRLIYTGTIDSYYAGKKAGTITEATPLDPRIGWRNLYARAKAASEEILTTLHRERGLPVVIFRPGIVIGRGGSPYHWGVGMWSWNAVCQIWGRGRNPLPLRPGRGRGPALIAALSVPGIEGESFNLIADTDLTAFDYLGALEDYGRSHSRSSRPLPGSSTPRTWPSGSSRRWSATPTSGRPSYRDWETRTQQARFDCTKAREVLDWPRSAAGTS